MADLSRDEFGILGVEQESEFALICFKGGGGGGGTGAIDYPVHMKQFHYQGLSDNGLDTINTSIADLVNLALATNPYTGLAPYAGTADLARMEVEWEKVVAHAGGLDCINWGVALTEVRERVDAEIFNEDYINAVVQAYSTTLAQELEEKAYPAFEAGMRDINAVMSSAFVVGRALIEESRVTQLTKYDADLRYKTFMQRNEIIAKGTPEFLEWYLKVFESKRQASLLSVDVLKTKIISEREYNEMDAKFAGMEANWEFEAFMYAGNFMASIGGGTYVPAAKNLSSGQSALSGVLSGAAMGTQVGGTGWGTVIGGALGGLGGMLGQ